MFGWIKGRAGRRGLAVLALACPLRALCAEAPSRPSAPPSSPTPPLEEVVVVAAKTPKVVTTYPAEGQTVPGGSVVLKIVFDQPMRPAAWAYAPVPGARFPDCLDRPRLLEDRRTFVLLCSAPLNAALALAVNADPAFTGSGGKVAEPFVLRFSTSNDPAANVLEALKSAALTEADNPIMATTAAGGAIVSDPVRVLPHNP